MLGAVILSAGATLLLVPGGASGLAHAKKKAKSACAVLTEAEIETAFAVESVDDGVERVSACSWDLDGGTRPAGTKPGGGIALAGGQLSVQYLPKNTAAFTGAQQLAGSNAQPVSGIGTKAFFDQSTGTLWVLKGKTTLSLQGLFGGTEIVADKAALLERLQPLARTALKRA